MIFFNDADSGRRCVLNANAANMSRFCYAPGLVISLLILVAAAIFGGPIAAAISAIAVVPTLIMCSLLTLLTLKRYSPENKLSAIGAGLGLYVISAIAVLLYLELFGPSQIM